MRACSHLEAACLRLRNKELKVSVRNSHRQLTTNLEALIFLHSHQWKLERIAVSKGAHHHCHETAFSFNVNYSSGRQAGSPVK